MAKKGEDEFAVTIFVTRGDVAGSQSIDAALRHILAALKSYRIWTSFAVNDIRTSYHRTVIGPFWYGIQAAVFVGVVSIVWSRLWGTSTAEYLPYLCISYILWTFISTTIGEGAGAFIEGDALINSFNMPHFVWLLRVVCKNVIVLAHTIPIYLLTALFVQQPMSEVVLGALLGLPLLIINLAWMSFVLGMLCLRFRDLRPMVGSLLFLAFVLTPILWHPSQVSSMDYLLRFNPFYHMLEVARLPLLGDWPDATSWTYVILLGAFGWTGAVWMYARKRNRLAFWL